MKINVFAIVQMFVNCALIYQSKYVLVVRIKRLADIQLTVPYTVPLKHVWGYFFSREGRLRFFIYL